MGKSVIVDGVEYNSLTDFAAAHGHTTRADRDKFVREYRRIQSGRPAKTRPVIIDGVEYASQTEAARALGVTRQAINDRVKRGKL